VIAVLDAVTGALVATVGIVAWRRFRTTAFFAIAAALVWFLTSAAPFLVMVHRPLLLHAMLALPRGGSPGPVSRVLLVVAWVGVVLPATSQAWVSMATAALCVAHVVGRSSPPAARSRPDLVAADRALLLFAAGLVVPVLERWAWPAYASSALPLATYLVMVSLCAVVMLHGILTPARTEDEVIELHGRTPPEALAELTRLAESEQHPKRAHAVWSAIELLEENIRLHRDLVDRIEEVRASRARLVQAALDERRRLERVLADGAQRYLDELEDCLTETEGHARGAPEVTTCLEEVSRTRDDLTQLGRGLHPRALAELGLAGALTELGRRSPLPVEVHAPVGRYAEPIETTIWYACAEGLANVVKHAHAHRVVVRVTEAPGVLRASIRDDGVGGASVSSDGGLAGLADRLSVVDGRLTVTSSPAGTEVRVEVPLR
jgi:signal transduction histidine kinase